MRYWFDTEFLENGPTEPIHLLSIGIVSEDNRSLYKQNLDCPFSQASEWVQEHVYPHIDGLMPQVCVGHITDQRYYAIQRYEGDPWEDRQTIAQSILTFIGDDIPEWWGYYADYDWVVLCQLFGSMINLPTGWPMYCRDFKQLCDTMGNPILPPQPDSEHHALAEARWIRDAWYSIS